MIIDTKYGKIEGIDQESYMEYRGVPYAKPPIGKLRWKAPQETDCWEGVYHAVDFRNKCVQKRHQAPPYDRDFYGNPDFERPMSEDCLYLHIWTPKAGTEKAAAEKLPVALWFHGGAFMGGYGSELEFDGKAYCERDVILVSAEYRCNVFGFLAHSWLTEENEKHISGNYGTLDQIAALKWVYENISAFGGDPENITLFGQSAGAMSVQTLVSTELTGNMIAKAIMQSGGSYGGGLHRDIALEEQERYGEIFADLMGAGSLEEMRAKPADEIAVMVPELIKKVLSEGKAVNNRLFLTPTIDGYVLDGGYYELMDEGKMKDIPYMLGTTKNDIMFTPEMVKESTYSELYQGCIAFSLKLEELGRKPAYVYYFTRDLPGDDFGAWHSCELWYMFGTMERCWRPWEETDYVLSRRMLDYWVNFMKTGDPNGIGLEVWQPCSRERAEIMELK